MKQKVLLTVLLACSLLKAGAQKIEKVFLDKSDTTKNCYTIIYPAKQPGQGYLFLVPGFGETPEEVLRQTDLPLKLAQNSILTIIPTFQDGVLSFGIDDISQQSFSRIISDVMGKHKLAGQKMYVGGFSIGGSCAVKYAENAAVKPVAVFAIDPPLDFERFYKSSKRDIRLSKDSEPNRENVYMVGRIEKEMNGTPATNLAGYYHTSPYSFSDTAQTAVKKLVQVPLRIYSEPDVQWWLRERRADFTGMNVTDCAAMINELNRLGNKNATLIITQDKGFRQPGNRGHPHSWSIVDSDGLITWLLEQNGAGK